MERAVESAEIVLDCEHGRALGCATFCCRLIVRLLPRERRKAADGVEKNCVDKAPDGLCVHLDRANHRCTIWHERPAACRDFDCNRSRLLPVVLREGFSSLVQLVTGHERMNVELRPETVPRRGR